MQANIANILFNSLIFALGIAPTLAMWVMEYRQIEFHSGVFMSLSLMFILIFVPLILIQNAYLFFKRNDEVLDAKLKWLSHVYLVANGICLFSWIVFMVK